MKPFSGFQVVMPENLLNAIELVVSAENSSKRIVLDNEKVQQVIQKNLAIYDKSGEMHYDIISAFIKSLRGSDPNAAVYWLARMVEAGEDPKFIARQDAYPCLRRYWECQSNGIGFGTKLF